MKPSHDRDFANLHIVRLSDLLLHEDHDPARLERLVESIAYDGVQANPVIVSPVPDGRFLILDGAHRVHALGKLGCSLALVQSVETPPEPESWCHVVPGLDIRRILEFEGFETEGESGEWISTLRTADSPDVHIYTNADEGSSKGGLPVWIEGLRGLQSFYPEGASITRTEYYDSGTGNLNPDEVEVVYRAFTVPELVEVVEWSEVLPAGITRFRIPERILGVRFPLDLLRSEDTEVASEKLRLKVRNSVRENRIRLYEEPVVLFE